MINFIALFLLLIVEAVIICIVYFKIYESKEIEIDLLNLTLQQRTNEIQLKNKQIKELQDELRAKTKTNKRL